MLATNVAETSLTVPGIRYVVDSGLARVKRYSYRNKVEQLQIEKIAQASANQRPGRCGRVAAGMCIRLYDEEDYAAAPAVHRSGNPALQPGRRDPAHEGAAPGRHRGFPFIEPPPPKAISDGYQLCLNSGAVTKRARSPRSGQELAKMPLDPRVGAHDRRRTRGGLPARKCWSSPPR